MIFTDTFTCDAIGDDEPITAPGEANVTALFRRIYMREQNAAMTAGFTVRAPYRDSPAVQYQAGELVVLEGTFVAGSVIGYIAAASGSLTMSLRAES